MKKLYNLQIKIVFEDRGRNETIIKKTMNQERKKERKKERVKV